MACSKAIEVPSRLVEAVIDLGLDMFLILRTMIFCNTSCAIEAHRGLLRYGPRRAFHRKNIKFLRRPICYRGSSRATSIRAATAISIVKTKVLDTSHVPSRLLCGLLRPASIHDSTAVSLLNNAKTRILIQSMPSGTWALYIKLGSPRVPMHHSGSRPHASRILAPDGFRASIIFGWVGTVRLHDKKAAGLYKGIVPLVSWESAFRYIIWPINGMVIT